MSERRAIQSLEAAAAFGRRSSLYQWMYGHYAEFAEVVRKAGRPNWKALTAEFEKLGLIEGGDLAPKPDTIRKVWLKVRQAVAREAQEGLRRQQSAAQPRDEFFPESGQAEGFVADNEFDDIERALGRSK